MTDHQRLVEATTVLKLICKWSECGIANDGPEKARFERIKEAAETAVVRIWKEK